MGGLAGRAPDRYTSVFHSKVYARLADMSLRSLPDSGSADQAAQREGIAHQLFAGRSQGRHCVAAWAPDAPPAVTLGGTHATSVPAAPIVWCGCQLASANARSAQGHTGVVDAGIVLLIT